MTMFSLYAARVGHTVGALWMLVENRGTCGHRGLLGNGPFLTLCYKWEGFPRGHLSSGLVVNHIHPSVFLELSL